MADVLYTTTEAVRAALGVEDIELSDETLGNLQLAEQLEVELDEIVPTHADIKLAGEAAAAGTPEAKAWTRLRLLSQYAAALICLTSSETWISQKISDSKAEMQRFQDSLDALFVKITDRKNYYLGLVNPESILTITGSPFLGIVDPAYDPVTNEGAT